MRPATGRPDEPRARGLAAGRAGDRRRPGRAGHGLPPGAVRTVFPDRGRRREIGQTWRSRWDSLRLFTSGRYDNLPGLPFPAAPDAYPGKDDVADYLQAYAAKFNLPVRLDVRVTSLTRGGGGYVAKAGGEALEARQVVVATGPFQVPFIPPAADGLDSGVHQIHSAHYRHPQSIPPGQVLVVGAANSGCQIARELSATHRVELVRRPADPGDPAAAAGP